MSCQPSPGPPHSAMYHQLPPAAASSKQKNKGHVAGITAGAEDVKYQGKYRELKKKVKEIELDNDKLYMKLLVAKKNIRRMHLERAILYERLAAVPPTPGRAPQELPAETDPLFAAPLPGPPPQEVPRPLPANERELDEYMRQHPNARVIQGSDGRIIEVEDGSSRPGALGLMGPNEAPGYRREPGTRYDSDRPPPPPPHGGPVPQIREPQPERADLPPDAHRPSRSSSAYSNHHRSRSSTARQDVDVQGDTRMDTLPPAHVVHSRSASIPEGVAEPRRRHEHLPAPLAMDRVERSPSQSPVHSPTHNRSLHNHQRIGPGVHLHRQQDRDPEERARLMAERQKEEEREREREVMLRERMAAEALADEELRKSAPWPQEDTYNAGHARVRSRSDTPVSSGVIRESPRPPADPYGGHAHPHPHYREREPYYEQRDDRLSVNPRGYAPEYRDTRKRSRQEMEVDDDQEMRSPLERTRSAGSGGGPAESFPVSQELRGPRRGRSEEPDMPRVHTSSIRDEKPMDQDD